MALAPPQCSLGLELHHWNTLEARGAYTSGRHCDRVDPRPPLPPLRARGSRRGGGLSSPPADLWRGGVEPPERRPRRARCALPSRDRRGEAPPPRFGCDKVRSAAGPDAGRRVPTDALRDAIVHDRLRHPSPRGHEPMEETERWGGRGGWGGGGGGWQGGGGL